jgi:hypothetical protein
MRHDPSGYARRVARPPRRGAGSTDAADPAGVLSRDRGRGPRARAARRAPPGGRQPRQLARRRPADPRLPRTAPAHPRQEHAVAPPGDGAAAGPRRRRARLPAAGRKGHDAKLRYVPALPYRSCRRRGGAALPGGDQPQPALSSSAQDGRGPHRARDGGMPRTSPPAHHPRGPEVRGQGRVPVTRPHPGGRTHRPRSRAHALPGPWTRRRPGADGSHRARARRGRRLRERARGRASVPEEAGAPRAARDADGGGGGAQLAAVSPPGMDRGSALARPRRSGDLQAAGGTAHVPPRLDGRGAHRGRAGRRRRRPRGGAAGSAHRPRRACLLGSSRPTTAPRRAPRC